MPIHLIILGMLILAAMQDYKTRKASNWLTMPLFLGGIVALILTPEILAISLSVLVIFFWHKGWMGGADTKVLVALIGLWYPAALAAFFALGLWGLVIYLKKTSKSFPGLVAIVLGVGLTFVGEISIMPLN